MTAADTAMVIAVSAVLGGFRPMATVGQTISFLRPVANDDVLVEARVLRLGRTLAFGEIALRGGVGRARCTRDHHLRAPVGALTPRPSGAAAASGRAPPNSSRTAACVGLDSGGNMFKSFDAFTDHRVCDAQELHAGDAAGVARHGARLRRTRDEHRQRILLTFDRGEELNVGAIAAVSTLSRPAVSHHLKILHQAGVLKREKRARRSGSGSIAKPWSPRSKRLSLTCRRTHESDAPPRGESRARSARAVE